MSQAILFLMVQDVASNNNKKKRVEKADLVPTLLEQILFTKGFVRQTSYRRVKIVRGSQS